MYLKVTEGQNNITYHCVAWEPSDVLLTPPSQSGVALRYRKATRSDLPTLDTLGQERPDHRNHRSRLPINCNARIKLPGSPPQPDWQWCAQKRQRKGVQCVSRISYLARRYWLILFVREMRTLPTAENQMLW
jgi:hypothetical protein